MRVVIADDSEIERQFVRKIARKAGHEVVLECANGLEAVHACRELKPDIVLLDIAMPSMTGDSAARIISSDGTADHIIIASSQSQGAIIAPLMEMGCRFAGKPYDPHQLGRILAEVAHGA